MQDFTFLRTVALISHGKLSHLTYRWKANSFTLEQIASILYKIERKRAKAAANTVGIFSITIGSLLLAAALFTELHYAQYNGKGETLFASFWTVAIGVNVIHHGTRSVRRLTYRRAMNKNVPASYAGHLRKFSDVLQEALKYLDTDLRTIMRLHRDDLAARSASLLESKAMGVVELERALDADNMRDDICDQLLKVVSERRENFKLAYAALADLHLVSGGYTNFFRRAINASKEAAVA